MSVSTAERAAVAQELLARRHARSSFIKFVQYVSPYYDAEPFHLKVAETLDLVLAGVLRKVMFIAPPQHGKSMLVSEHFPAYWLGKRPDDPIITTSYGSSRAEANSRAARQIVEGDEFRALFGNRNSQQISPVETDPTSRAVDHWRLNAPHRGRLLAAGVSGPVTGHGAMLGIIDDPLRDWEDAQSATIRDKNWEWYQNTFLSRMWEYAAQILILTRWHALDLAGRLIQSEGDVRDGGEWTILRFPALAETQQERDENNRFLGLPVGEADPLGRQPGEALAPKRFSAATLEARRKTSGFSALYQGVPRPAEGDRFKRVWFEAEDRIVPYAPFEARRIRYWDKAGSETESAKFTAGVLLAEYEDLWYIEDVVRGKWSAGKREEIILQTAQADAERYGSKTAVKIWVEQEPGSGGKESADNTVKNLKGFVIKTDRPTGSKDVRLEPFQSQAEAGNVRMVRGAWNTDYVDEFAAIPNGAYRDQADATAGAFNKLNGRPELPAPRTL